MFAAAHGRYPALKFLLTAAPRLALRADRKGRSPAYLAAEAGHASCLKLLLDLAPATATAVAAAKRGYTPAHAAAFCGHAAALQHILKVAPAAAVARTSDGSTPM